MNNSRSFTRHRSWLTTYRVLSTVFLAILVVIGCILLFRPAQYVPSVAEIAYGVNGPTAFQRPSAMEYVAKTDSCVVGGTVTSTEWHLGTETFAVGDVDSKSVEYTSFGFKSDDGRIFTVSENSALFTSPGENLGLELRCDPATMNSADSFGMVAIVFGGM